jgi:hypothetical protein
MRSVIKLNQKEISFNVSPFWIYHFLELIFELLLIVKVNERYESAFEFLYLIEIVVKRGGVTDAQNGHCMMNWVFNIPLATICDVQNNLRMSCYGWKKRKETLGMSKYVFSCSFFARSFVSLRYLRRMRTLQRINH